MGDNLMAIILEQDFYDHDKGFPLEDPVFARFSFGCNLNEYDSFGIVNNSYPMYVRIFPLRGGCQDGDSISEEGRYANLDSITRDKECPKIAWGFSAYLFDCFNVIANGERRNRKNYDYVISHDSDSNFDIDEINAKTHYLNLLWEDYRQTHSGIKYKDVSERSKKITFLRQHLNDEKRFWKQTEPVLKKYLISSANQIAGKLLYDSIEDITKQYFKQIKKQKNEIQYKWFYMTIGFVKKNTLKILYGFLAALFAYIYKDSAVVIYHYICRLLEKF